MARGHLVGMEQRCVNTTVPGGSESRGGVCRRVTSVHGARDRCLQAAARRGGKGAGGAESRQGGARGRTGARQGTAWGGR
nr:unnamed protein product [Digitaria exilis]